MRVKNHSHEQLEEKDLILHNANNNFKTVILFSNYHEITTNYSLIGCCYEDRSAVTEFVVMDARRKNSSFYKKTTCNSILSKAKRLI